MFTHAVLAEWSVETLGVLVGGVIAVVAIVTSTWYQFMRMHQGNRLKQAMVERGMSVEEIERVLAAKSAER